MRAAGAACLVASLACGVPATPRDVKAWVSGSGVEIAWEPSPVAAAHQVQLADLDRGTAASAPVIVRGNRALLPGRASGVFIDAIPGGRTAGLVSSGPAGGDGSGWQIFAPWDFRGGALTVAFDRIGGDERIGVLLVNFGGRDGADAEVIVDGVSTGPAPADSVAQRSALAATSVPWTHDALRARESALAAERPAPAEMVSGARQSFCIAAALDFSHHVRKAAALALSTEHADLYVDEEDLGEYEGPDMQLLGQALEERVWPSVTGTFGVPPDVDGSGKLIVVLTHELGAHLNGGWLLGYFGNADLVRSRDDSSGCSGSGSNHGAIVYLNDLRNGAANGYAASDLLQSGYPATIAHELQHLLNYGNRCLRRSCDGPEEVWINEALSKVAEDVAGYGWNATSGRSEGAAYLGRSDGDLRGYDGRSLTRWEGDPIGNYQGAHSFLRLFTDRAGTDLAGRIALGRGGLAGLESALGMPLPMAMAEWATALLLSNEAGSRYSFSGIAWSPLHDRLRHLDTRVPGTVSLRHDGIAAVMSGAGLDAKARVLVRSREENPPYVVVVRASASLPAR